MGIRILTAKEAALMTSQTVSGSKPIIILKEKRKFNWMVLAMLILTIAIGVIAFIQAL